MAKLTVKDILDAKGKTKLTEVWVNSFETAQACEIAGIDMLITEVCNLKQVRMGAPNTFITGWNPKGIYNSSEAEAIKAAFSLLDNGADAVYMDTSLEKIKAVTKEHVPVRSHVGFVPDRLTWFGKHRAVGKTAQEALQVYRETIALQDAGVYAVEMEVVPHKIASEITKRVDVFVISLGSGPGCDSEFLFCTDILGSYMGHYPRHTKQYRKHFEDSCEAFKEFKSDVENGAFPEKRHVVEIKDEEFGKFMKEINIIA